MEDCLFCKIIAGTIPCEKVYEDDKVFAILDIHPINRGHTLVLPKKHAKNLFDVPEEDFLAMMRVTKKLATVIKSSVGADGMNLGMNNDHAAGQLVFHAHVHIIPRFEDDGFAHWHGNPYSEGEMPSIARSIRENIA
jgi:histidine triad (HIT) family protein